MENALVSIIVPIYNMGNLLEKNAETFLGQSYRNIELILVDDGSKDDSLAVCRRLAEQDARVRVFHQENKGSGEARNHGIREAKGKYVYFPDADDRMEQDAIAYLVDEMEKEPCSLLVFGYDYINEDGKTLKEKSFQKASFEGEYVRAHYERFLTMNSEFAIQGAPWNKFFLMEVIRQHQVFYPDLRRNQDEVFIMRYVNYIEGVRFLSRRLYSYFANDTQRTWMKFPLDYFEIVSQLNRFRMEIIYPWNPENAAVLRGISASFADSTNNCLLLLFNPKWRLTHRERYRRMKEIVERFHEELPDKEYDNRYLKYRLIRKKANSVAISLLPDFQ